MKKTVVSCLALLMGMAILSVLFEFYRVGSLLGLLFIAASATAGLKYSAANQDFGPEDITGDFRL